jgi:lipocalin
VGVKPENKFTQICGYADVLDVSEPGALTVQFSWKTGGNYWVIGTDYENYASIYSCKSFLIFSLEYSWVLVRDPANVTPKSKEAALKAFTDNGLSTDKFEDTVQSNCTYEDPNVPPCKTED